MSGATLIIKQAWVIPWHDGGYGVAYEYLDGGSDCNFIGTGSEAQAIADEINRQIAASAPPAPRDDNVISLADAAFKYRRG